MNATFKLGELSMQSEAVGDMRITGLEVSVEGLDLKEYMELMVKMPQVFRESLDTLNQCHRQAAQPTVTEDSAANDFAISFSDD